jgi:hypothetical protein
MELNITELDNSYINYEQIPENMAPKIKVVKKENKVRFEDLNQNINQNIKPMNSGAKARMVRPAVQAPKPQISYDDILSKMGMFVADGQLHLLEDKSLKQQQTLQKQTLKQQYPVQEQSFKQPHLNQPLQQTPNVQNSYIYNKYFQNNDYNEQPIQKPMTSLEYRDVLINDIIQKYKIKQLKSTKLIMPNSNINFAPGSTSNLNKLFGFSKR